MKLSKAKEYLEKAYMAGYFDGVCQFAGEKDRTQEANDLEVHINADTLKEVRDFINEHEEGDGLISYELLLSKLNELGK